MSPGAVHPVYQFGIFASGSDVDVGFGCLAAAILEFQCDVGRAILLEGLAGVACWRSFPDPVAISGRGVFVSTSVLVEVGWRSGVRLALVVAGHNELRCDNSFENMSLSLRNFGEKLVFCE